MKKVTILLALCSTVFCAAQAQGLIGAAPETRFGRSDEQTICIDQAYEAWKSGSLAVTGLVAIVALCSSAKMLRRKGRAALRKAMLLSVAAPACSYAAGTVLVNNLWRWF